MKTYKLINFCEFDKFAEQSYCAIHNVDKSLNLGDITQVNEKEIADFDMICGGSPCQDFSVAGNQKGSKWMCKDCNHEYNPLTVHYSERNRCPNCGSENLDKTRSSLLVEWLRIIREKKPKWGIYENVKNIVGKKFKETFDMFINELNEYGYNTYYKVLNAKDYGIPQNRERVYLILIQKDLDNGKFNFPIKTKYNKTLNDILEKETVDKYYLTEEKTNKLLNDLSDKNILANNIVCEERYDEGLRFFKDNNIGTIRTINAGGEKRVIQKNKEHYKIRKLTPLECWRLMGFSDEDFLSAKLGSREKAKELIQKYEPDNHLMLYKKIENKYKLSNTQCYKQAGNSIVINVLYFIYQELYKAMPYLFDNLKVSSFFSGIGAFEIALNKLYKSI